MADLVSDFWWLPKNADIDNLLVGVGNHIDVVDNEDIPPISSWYRSINKDSLSNTIEYYSIAFLGKWRIRCKNTNVYRTLKVFDCKTKEAIFLGPFLVDIDNKENLDAAQGVAKQVIEYLIAKFKHTKSDLRIFFTGNKGFNIEMRPETCDICGSVPDQIKLSYKNLDNIITSLRINNNVQDSTLNIVDGQRTVIDRIYANRFGYKLKYPFIRLHNSINRWVGGNGKVISRKKIELTSQELIGKSIVEILSESETQV